MKKINLSEKLSLFNDYWNPRIVGELNGQQVKLVKFKGPFTWHHHENEDELFLVLKGRFRMEYRDSDAGSADHKSGSDAKREAPNQLRAVWVEEGEMIIVPRGTEHRPVADEEAHVLLFEPASILNTGNVRNEFTVATLDRL